MLFTNKNNIPLPLAVWLATDDYDFIGGTNRISVTSLIKPTRRFIIASRVPPAEREYDISDFIPSRRGHAFHDSIESAWKNSYRSALKKLGYPDSVIDAVRINPTEPEEGTLPVYLEKRSERDIHGYTISGKFDMTIEGELYDTKSTSVYAHIMGNRDQDYIKQGSYYKWLNPDIITGDHIHIQHIFTDWSKGQARTQKNYPQSPLDNRTLPLMSMEETEHQIGAKVKEIEQFWKAPDNEIPFCTDEELWRSAPKHKYYANPKKTDGRSTKNFDDLASAMRHKSEAGKGVVITVPGQVKACSFCPAFLRCEQRLLYEHDSD